MSAARNERLRARSNRFPYRTALKMLPLHALRELDAETRLAWLRLTRRGIDRRYASATDLLVNVGCGSQGRQGWINVDSVAARGVTCVRDCRTALPLASGSARAIFTEHFLEHLDYYEEAPKFLDDCRRVLSPGGVLRIIVPDGGKYLSAYCGGGLEDMSTFSPLLTLEPESDAAPFSLRRDVLPFRTKMEVVNFHFRQSGQHRFSYDFETLARLLSDCGFTSIVKSEFGVSGLPELAIDSESRAGESLVVEARSPTIVRSSSDE